VCVRGFMAYTEFPETLGRDNRVDGRDLILCRGEQCDPGFAEPVQRDKSPARVKAWVQRHSTQDGSNQPSEVFSWPMCTRSLQESAGLLPRDGY